MFIPYDTDAPIYHWPFATGGLIAACVLVSTAFWMSIDPWNLGLEEMYILQYDRISPLQWTTSLFSHADIFHLLGNALGLWVFGLIVEGKVGWVRLMGLFLGMGILQSAIEQVVMFSLGVEGASLGASSAIYGLMAIAIIWAPVNSVSCVVFVFVFRIFRAYTFDLPIAGFVGLYLFLDFVTTAFSGFAVSSSLLHLMGAALGFVAGIAMLKLGWVDCERWDAFSLIAGRHQRGGDDELGEWKAAEREETPAVRHQKREAALRQIREILEEGNALLAYQAHRKMRKDDPLWQLPVDEFLSIIEGLQAEGSGATALPACKEFMRAYPERAHVVRLVAARILIESEQRPGQARKVLSGVKTSRLTDAQQRAYQRLAARAEQLFQEDPYEVAEDW